MNTEIETQDDKIDFESLEEMTKDAAGLIPKMDMPPTVTESNEEKNLVSDEMLLGLFDEAMGNIRQNIVEADELQSKFEDLTFNDGDGTTSTKEALVNLFKIKVDLNDKITKIADLASRIYLKETNTFPKYLAAHQNNTINIDAKRTPLTPEEKRKIIEQENKKLGNK